MDKNKPLYDSAYEDYKKGLKYKEIAEKYNVSVDTVKSWKTRHWNKKSVQPSDIKTAHKIKEACTQKAKGGQPKNKNAVGNSGGAPAGNKNNFQHGAYESIYWDCLEDTESEMIQSMQFDEEEQLLIEQMQLLTVRERRLLHRIKEFENKKGGLALDSVTKRTAEENGNKIQNEVTTHTISTFEVIQKLEAELTKVQGRKTKCIESLDKIRNSREELEIKKREIAMKEKEMELKYNPDEDNEITINIINKE